jgi:hypothetical protein
MDSFDEAITSGNHVIVYVHAVSEHGQ